MQNSKYPTKELLFAIVANNTLGHSNHGLSATDIFRQARHHHPTLKINTVRELLRRMVLDNWVAKTKYLYSVRPNHINTVWLDRLRWLEFLDGAAKAEIVEQVKNM